MKNAQGRYAMNEKAVSVEAAFLCRVLPLSRRGEI